MNSEMTKFASNMILFRVAKMKANWKKNIEECRILSV